MQEAIRCLGIEVGQTEITEGFHQRSKDEILANVVFGHGWLDGKNFGI